MQIERHNILFVRGSTDVEDHVVRTYRHAYWSGRFDAVLKKNGLIDIEIAFHPVLGKAHELNQYPVLFLAWIPEIFWTSEMIAGVLQYCGVIIAEGPLPERLHQKFGVRVLKGGGNTSSVTITDEKIDNFFRRNYSSFYHNQAFNISPKKISTREVLRNRWDIDFDPRTIRREDLIKRIIRSFRIPYWNRVKKMSPMPFTQDSYLMMAFLGRDAAAGGDVYNEITAQAGNFLRILPDNDTPLTTYVANLFHTQLVSREKQTCIRRGGAIRTAALRLRQLFYGHYRINHSKDPDVLAFFREKISEKEKKYFSQFIKDRIEFRNESPFFLRSCNLVDAARIILALGQLGRKREADIVVDFIVRESFDFEDGRFVNATFTGVTARKAKGVCVHPLVGLALLSITDTTQEEKFIGLTFEDQYGDIQKLWEETPYSFCGYVADTGRSLAHFNDAHCEMVTEFKNTILFGFQAFSYIMHHHTMHPLRGPFTDCDASGAMLTEGLINLLLKRAASFSGVSFVRISPWPAGYKTCLTIRHDVDRIPDERTFSALLDFEKKNHLGVSWYWIFSRLNDVYINRQEEAGHEIGLHSMRHNPSCKKRELEVLSGYLKYQKKIVGEFVHGGGGGEYWLGWPSIEASENAGLSYSEKVSTYYGYPYFFPYLDAEGQVHLSSIVTLSHCVSVDRHGTVSKRPWNSNRVSDMLKNGYHLMVLNHPDQYLGRLERIVADIPEEGRLDWTAAKVADWWQKTHGETLIIHSEVCEQGIRLSVRSSESIHGLQVEVFDPQSEDGEGFHVFVLDMSPGVEQIVSINIAPQKRLVNE